MIISKFIYDNYLLILYLSQKFEKFNIYFIFKNFKLFIKSVFFIINNSNTK